MRDLKLIAVLLGVLVFIAAGVVLRELQSVLLPFVVAVFLSIIFKPIVLWMTRRRVPMGLALVVVLIVISGLVFGLSLIIGASASAFIAALPKYQARLAALTTSIEGMVRWAGAGLGLQPGQLQLSNMFDVGMLTGAVSSGIGALLAFLGDAFMIVLFLVFILAGSGQLSRKIEHGFHDEHARRIASIIGNIDDKVRTYLVTKTLISLATGGLSALVLWILGVDFPLLWGFLAFLLNFIPNIGSLIATIFPVGIALLQFDTLLQPLLALALLVVIQNLLGNVLEPKLMAFSLNLSPLLVLASLIFWGWLWGIWGMILAVPIMSTIKIVFEHVDALRPVALLMSGGGGKG